MASSKPKSASGDIRRRLLAGEPLTSEQVASEYGASKSLLSTVLKSLEVDGAVIERKPLEGGSRRGGEKSFRVTSPEPTADKSEWGKARGAKRMTTGRATNGNGTKPAKPVRSKAVAALNGTQAVVRAAVNGKGMATDHPVPQLGESVQVFLLALGDDGQVSVGLRDGEQTWLTSVQGFAKR